MFNLSLDLWSLAKQECSARPPVACKARMFNLQCSMFRSTSGRLQSKNIFSAKIQQTKRSNLTFRSFRFFSFDSFFSFFSPLIVHRLFVWLIVIAIKKEFTGARLRRFVLSCQKPFPPIMLISFQIPPKDLSIQFLSI